MKKIILILGLLLLLSNVYAQTDDVVGEEDKIEGQPQPSMSPDSTPPSSPVPVDDLKFKTGVISSTGSTKSSTAIDATSLDAIPGEEEPAVSGNVSNKKGDCSANVTNNSEVSSYSVSYEVQGINERGVVVFRKSFSARLSPGESVNRDFSCREGLGMSLVLKSGKKIE